MAHSAMPSRRLAIAPPGNALEAHVAGTAALIEALLPVLSKFVCPPTATHIGGLLADAALQSGVRYRTVVQPRVQSLVAEHPEAASIAGLVTLLSHRSARTLLRWSHPAKPARFVALTDACAVAGVNTCADFYEWITTERAQVKLLSIQGVGRKTVDYLTLLAGHSTVPLDRHFIRFLRFASVPTDDHAYAQHVFAEACMQRSVDVRSTERTVWLLCQACG